MLNIFATPPPPGVFAVSPVYDYLWGNNSYTAWRAAGNDIFQVYLNVSNTTSAYPLIWDPVNRTWFKLDDQRCCGWSVHTKVPPTVNIFIGSSLIDAMGRRFQIVVVSDLVGRVAEPSPDTPWGLVVGITVGIVAFVLCFFFCYCCAFKRIGKWVRTKVDGPTSSQMVGPVNQIQVVSSVQAAPGMFDNIVIMRRQIAFEGDYN